MSPMKRMMAKSIQKAAKIPMRYFQTCLLFIACFLIRQPQGSQRLGRPQGSSLLYYAPDIAVRGVCRKGRICRVSCEDDRKGRPYYTTLPTSLFEGACRKGRICPVSCEDDRKGRPYYTTLPTSLFEGACRKGRICPVMNICN